MIKFIIKSFVCLMVVVSATILLAMFLHWVFEDPPAPSQEIEEVDPQHKEAWVDGFVAGRNWEKERVAVVVEPVPVEIKAGQVWVYHSKNPFAEIPHQTNRVIAVSNNYVKFENCYGMEWVSTEWGFRINSTLQEEKK